VPASVYVYVQEVSTRKVKAATEDYVRGFSAAAVVSRATRR
jgi:hypothetical protein